jgi:hypothetical protein
MSEVISDDFWHDQSMKRTRVEAKEKREPMKDATASFISQNQMWHRCKEERENRTRCFGMLRARERNWGFQHRDSRIKRNPESCAGNCRECWQNEGNKKDVIMIMLRVDN